MKVAIDARMVTLNSMHGIARYVFELLKGIRALQAQEYFYILVNPNSPLKDEPWPDNMQIVEINAPWISVREQWELPRALKRLQADIFHSPSFVAPLFCPCRLLMTIHDLNHIGLPQYYTPIHQLYYQTLVKYCTSKSDYVLTVSEFSKREIVRFLGMPPDKIVVTHNGVSDRFAPVVDKEYRNYLRDIYQLPDQFIFCVTNNKPHKNIQQLVRAYCFSDIEIPLVLACPVDQEAILIAENFGKKHQLYFIRYILDEHLAGLYSLARLFVYPSTYEGFGLPPLEALASGTSVVVANSSSLPEVMGDCAVFADPFDYEDIAKALVKGLEVECYPSAAARRGIMRARSFTWTRMSETTLDIYRSCYEHMTATQVAPAGN